MISIAGRIEDKDLMEIGVADSTVMTLVYFVGCSRGALLLEIKYLQFTLCLNSWLIFNLLEILENLIK